VSGAADGFMIAADKTKLDGIATGATAGPALSSTTPAALGVAAVGVGTTAARADHVHQAPTAAGDVVGPASSVTGRVAAFSGTTGKLLADGAKLAADLVTGPASVTTGRVASFSGTTGKIIAQGTQLAADLVSGPASVTANMVCGFNGTTGKLVKAGTADVDQLVTNASGVSIAGCLAVFSDTTSKVIRPTDAAYASFPWQKLYSGHSASNILTPAATWTDFHTLCGTWVDDYSITFPLKANSTFYAYRGGRYSFSGYFMCGGAASETLVGYRLKDNNVGSTVPGAQQIEVARAGAKSIHRIDWNIELANGGTYDLQMIRVGALTTATAPGTLDGEVLWSAALTYCYLGSIY
jgi:hypothetical protein